MLIYCTYIYITSVCFAWKLLQAEFPLLNKILTSPRVDCVKLRFPVRFLWIENPWCYFHVTYYFSHHPALFLAPCC